MKHPYSEPAVIGDELLQERIAAKDETEMDDTYDHWLTGMDTPLTIAGTTIPGNIRLAACAPQLSQTLAPPEPMLDLSWTPPDVDAILADMLDALGLSPDPKPIPEPPAIAVYVSYWDHELGRLVDDWPLPEEPVTQELKPITTEEEL